MAEFDLLETTTDANRERNKWRVLAGIAAGGLIATEIARRAIVQLPDVRGGALFYWFLDHVFFDGPLLVLTVAALVPVPRKLGLRWLMPLLGAVLMVGSFFQLANVGFLAAVGLFVGVALKSVDDSEGLDILLAIGGMGLGIPLNGFGGLMAAKTGFAPSLMGPLFGSTAGVGSAAIACAGAGVYLLGWRWREKMSRI